MADNKFPSLSSFLKTTKTLEKNTMETALNKTANEETQRILSEASVKLSVYNSVEEHKLVDKTQFIHQSVQEAVEANASRIKSILEDVFSSLSVDEEREVFWINKLCNLFNISKDLTIEEKSALIDKQLAEDDDTLNYVTYLVESGERSHK